VPKCARKPLVGVGGSVDDDGVGAVVGAALEAIDARPATERVERACEQRVVPAPADRPGGAVD
jgi:hypothetical protein